MTTLLLLVLPLIGGLVYLYAVARVWRAEPMLGIAMLLFWPVGLYALAKYWNDDEAALRRPLLAAFGLFAIWLGALIRGAGSVSLPEEDLALDDSEQASSAGEDGGLADQVRRSVALGSLPQQTGRVDFPGAHASIEVPTHFRFIDRDALVKAFAGTEDEPGEQLLGWLVHEKVDLTGKDAWHIEVGRLADGWISDETFAAQSRETLLATGKQATKAMSDAEGPGEPSYSLVGYADMPRLDAAAHSATWVEEIAYEGKPAHVLDCYSIRLGRDSALIYTITEMAMSRRELCLRAVRLMAGRSGFEHGKGYADRSRLLDRKAPYDLVGLVTGSALSQQK